MTADPRRCPMFRLILSVLVAVPFVPAARAEQPKRPNVVVILADDRE